MPYDCLFVNDYVVVTNCQRETVSIHLLSLQHEDIVHDVIESDNLKFPFGLWIDGKSHIFVSDFYSHCIYQVMIEREKLMTVV